MILIIGGTGTLGRLTAQMLLERALPVRIMARDTAKAAELRHLGAEVLQGDLTDRASLERACEGVEKIFSAAHGLLGRGKNASLWVDDRGHRQLIDIAVKNGVQHFVYTSVLGVRADHPVAFCRTKYAIEAYLCQSGLSFTILRPSAFFLPHATLVGEPILQKGKTNVLGQGDAVRNLVAPEDVAAFAVMALTDERLRGDTILIGGPDNLSNNQVATLYGKIAGVQPKVSHMPRGVLRVMGTLIRPFHPGISNIMRWSLYSDTVEEPFDNSATLQKYPVHMTNLENWARKRL